MTQRAGATIHRPSVPRRVWVAALAALASTGLAHAADDAAETARLAALLRQLDALERVINTRSPSEPTGHSRYHFDYARLEADVARIRAGIDDYLRPTRAQPRDPDQLIGEYRLPGSTP